jgi:hypothetical protein
MKEQMLRVHDEANVRFGSKADTGQPALCFFFTMDPAVCAAITAALAPTEVVSLSPTRWALVAPVTNPTDVSRGRSRISSSQFPAMASTAAAGGRHMDECRVLSPG